jgi:ribosomal protein L9
MDKNTVVLDLEEYNKLRDFKEGIEKGNSFTVYWGSGYAGYKYKVVTTDEVVKQIMEANNNINKEKNNLIQQLYNCQHPESKVFTVEDIKKMSIWKFLKWRKK